MKHINYKITLTHVIDRNSQDILGTFYHKKEDALEAFDNYKLDDEDKGEFIITLSEVFENENGKETINTLKVKELKKELKYGYQAVHDNCEPYEDNYTIHESTIYMNKETLIKRLISEGYKCIQDNQELTVFSKTLNKDYQRYDDVEIRKVIIEEG